MSKIMSIAQIRGQLQMADVLAKSGVDFIVVPITSEEEKVELGLRAIANIDLLESKEQQK